MNQPTAEAIEIATEAASEPMSFEDEEAQIKKLYDDMEKSDFRTEEEYLAHITDNPPETDENTEGVSEVTQETPPDSEVDDLQAAEEPVIVTPEPASGDTVETLKEQLRISNDRYKSLDGKIEQRGRELAEATRKMQEFQPFIKNMGDPAFRQHTLNYFNPQQPQQPGAPAYDPDDPKSVTDFIRQNVSNEFQAQQQQQTIRQRQQAQRDYQNNWIGNVQRNRENMIAAGYDAATVENAINILTKSYMSGNVADIAVRYANYDAAIAAAEKRGREQTIKDIKDKQKTTGKRTVAESTGKPQTQKKAPHDMTPEEVAEELKTLPVDSIRAEELVRFAMTQTPGG